MLKVMFERLQLNILLNKRLQYHTFCQYKNYIYLWCICCMVNICVLGVLPVFGGTIIVSSIEDLQAGNKEGEYKLFLAKKIF